MNLFNYHGTIKNYLKIDDFLEAYEINEDDLILSSHGIYQRYLKEKSINAHFIFHDDFAKGEPSDEKIDSIIESANQLNYTRVIAIGGGSVIDIAKILSLKDVKHSIDYFENKIDLIKDKKLLAIPTTCGTGSEVTNIVVSAIVSKNTKMGMSDETLLPDEAILIPEFLEDLPFKVYMHSSIDALIHAVESYLSPNANQITDALSLQAIKNIFEIYNTISTAGKEQRKESFNKILIASTLAGLSFNNAGVGAVHALSYPLGAKYHVPHGESNFQFFTEVMKTYYDKNPKGKIKTILKLIEQLFNFKRDHFEQLNQLICNLVEKPKLRTYGMKAEEIDLFAHRVMDTQQRLLKNNYERLTYEEIKKIYKNLY